MQRRGHRGFDNQPPAAPGTAEYLPAREAAALLGVKRATLYAYASRGLVRTVPSPGATVPRGRCYHRDDLLRLKARHDARAGHTAVAAAALLWGEPVLESSISRLGPEGPAYRGHLAVDLAARATPFESVAELLWTSALPAVVPAWRGDARGDLLERVAGLLPAGAHPLVALGVLVPAAGANERPTAATDPAADLARARSLVRCLAAGVGLGFDAARSARALGAEGVARVVLASLGADAGADAVRALDLALVLLADHELNPSTFAARVAASTGAGLHACVAAALATLTGARHGGACDRVEALLAGVGSAARAPAAVRDWTARGVAMPGFGQPVYPLGDPRAAPLLAVARALDPTCERVRTLEALVTAMRDAGHQAPTVDLGLVALAAALRLPAGAAAGIFAVGRSAGWVAHALEQGATGVILRPRALYREATT